MSSPLLNRCQQLGVSRSRVDLADTPESTRSQSIAARELTEAAAIRTQASACWINLITANTDPAYRFCPAMAFDADPRRRLHCFTIMEACLRNSNDILHKAPPPPATINIDHMLDVSPTLAP